MIPIIAWRNIWRNTTRSLVVIGAIALGIWAAMFMSGFATGMAKSYVNNAVEDVVSHLQVHHAEFKKEKEPEFQITDPALAAERIRELAAVRAVSVRAVVQGMLASGNGSRGIMVRAVDPAAEAGVSALDQKIVEGAYLEDRKNSLLISTALSERLKVGLRSKVVLTFLDMDDEITSAAFRIVGIFETSSKPFDESHVYVRRPDLSRLLRPDTVAATAPLAHEMAIMVDDPEQVSAVQQQLQSELPDDLIVETYRQVSPDLELYESQIQSLSLIYLTIIMLALVFGIVNTMLMAVLERVRELGMLMAIGMNKWRVFAMIVLETILLAVVAAPAGMLLGYATVAYLRKYGIDLSAFSESLREYGLSDTVYFDLDPIVYWQVPIMVGVTAIIASVYPALKAIRLRPVEAIRKF